MKFHHVHNVSTTTTTTTTAQLFEMAVASSRQQALAVRSLKGSMDAGNARGSPRLYSRHTPSPDVGAFAEADASTDRLRGDSHFNVTARSHARNRNRTSTHTRTRTMTNDESGD